MQRITSYEREQIDSLARQGKGVREIGKAIGRDHSVVSRELGRNKAQLFPYEAASAQHYAERRAKKTNVRKLEKYPRLREWVREKLRKKWSPEQIAGRLREQPPPELGGLTVSHEAIYQWIYDASPKGEPWLYHHLRRKHADRQPRCGRKKRGKDQVKGLVPLGLRPEISGLGHFEVDSVVGRGHRSGLSVHYEKTSQWVRIHPLGSLRADETRDALRATLEDLPPRFAQTLTFDRGSETALHYQLREPYGLATFHCDPYCPWQKGGVENANGLVRQFFPKKTDFRSVTTEEIALVEDLLNERPRKGLGYRTPNEVMGGALNA
jgi:IS30 family transposase